MIIGPTQTFIFSLLAGGAYGARRGWAKEVITTAVVLSDVLFLSNGGAGFLSHILSSTIGSAGGTALGGPLFAGGGGTAPPYTGTTSFGTTAGAACTAALTTAVSRITFVGMTWLGYRSGTRHGPAPKMSSHRVAGIVPGAINGAAIAYYVSNNILPGTSVLLNTPGSIDTSSYLPVVFGIGIVALLIVLFIAGQMKKAASSGGSGGGH
ncbi:MAG TPA: hypothetical protein VJQ45_05005 [Ktedonobacterales bacterium]|nr:hypothetical protein [Ktedonobacterales bacterium]